MILVSVLTIFLFILYLLFPVCASGTWEMHPEKKRNWGRKSLAYLGPIKSVTWEITEPQEDFDLPDSIELGINILNQLCLIRQQSWDMLIEKK